MPPFGVLLDVNEKQVGAVDALGRVARHEGLGDGGPNIVRRRDEYRGRSLGAALGKQKGPALARQHRSIMPGHERIDIALAAEAMEKERGHGALPK
jgi:hypothetical protein